PTTSETREHWAASKQAADFLFLSPQPPPFHSGYSWTGSLPAWRRSLSVEQAKPPQLGFEHSPRLDSAQRHRRAPDALPPHPPPRRSPRRAPAPPPPRPRP